ncbi:hypothetical protein BCEN4_590025 [Burkholderia cenocepacia]|nr:hypothetical protein BCEN4_590025 [Burkholderia cenocepacia]
METLEVKNPAKLGLAGFSGQTLETFGGYLVEAAGIEPASRSAPRLVLHV